MELSEKLERQSAIIEELKQLDEKTLTKQPADGGWSATECMVHMNLAMEIYLDQFESMKGRLKPANGPYKPTFLARKLIQSQPPDKKGMIRFKIKTMKRLDPHHSDLPADRSALDRLEDNLSRLRQFTEMMQGKDPKSFKVKTVLGPMLKLYAGDAVRFISAHNERHFRQIQNILKKTAGQE
jgi:hypothetical protein